MTLSSRLRARAQTGAGIAVIGGTAVAVATAGAAYAAWAVSGTTTVTTTSATITALTVSATLSTALYPGATGSVSLAVTNPNPFPVTLTSLVFGSVTSGNTSACASSNVTVANPSSFNLVVAAGATSPTTVLANDAAMLSSAPTGCAGVSFSVPATVSGTSS